MVNTTEVPKNVSELRAQYAAIEKWNAEVPDGTHVIWKSLHGETLTKTRGQALMINGWGFVYLYGVHGAKRLDEIRPAFCRWVKFNRDGVENKWQHGAWASEQAMLDHIQVELGRDRAIRSYEVSNLEPDSAS